MILTLKKPLDTFSVSQLFGGNGEYYRANGINIVGHNGIDLNANDGDPVYASHDGVVVFAGHDNMAGLGVVIRTKEKFDYMGGKSMFKTIYWHLKEGSVLVKPDQKVKVGEKIAEADSTGFSTGPHLHWSLKPIYQGEKSWEFFNSENSNGYGGAIDPMPYLEGAPYLFQKDMEFDGGLSYDNEVAAFQDFLIKEKHLSPLPPEEKGFYGNKTRKAVFKFQTEYVGLSWYEKTFLKGLRVGTKTRNIANTIIIRKAFK